MPGRDGNVGAARAREARAALGLRPDEPFTCVLSAIEQRAGVPVIVAALPGETAGCCMRMEGRSYLFVNGTQYVGRQRFTLAHEYGHHVLGHEAGAPDSKATIYGRTLSSAEVQANAFAAEFLAPAAAVRDMVDHDPTLETIARIAGHFGISMQAALVRLNNLRLTERDDELRAELADPQLRRWVRPSERDDELARIGRHLPRVSPLLEGTLLSAALRGDAAADPALSRALPLLMR